MRADSSSGLSLPLFSFLLNACRGPATAETDGRRRDTDEGNGGDGTVGTDDEDETGRGQSDRGRRGRKREREERKVRGRLGGYTGGTYTQSLSADHQINVLVYFPVLVLRLGAVADRVVRVGVWAVTAV